MPIDSDDEFAEMFAIMQASVAAHQIVLREIIADLAKHYPGDPSRYIASVYDRVIAAADRRPPEKQGAFDANFREAIENILMKAGNSLKR